MTKRIAVARCGAVGRALVERLLVRGDKMRIVQRKAPPGAPPGCRVRLRQSRGLTRGEAALANVDIVVCAVGVPYKAEVYSRVWPIVMRNLLDASARWGARFVFADSLYMYGPQTRPLTEEMPVTDYGRKPRVRAEITRLWQDAH